MIKSYTVMITEVDEAEDAIAEVKEKLGSIPLLKNTVGIVSVHPEYFINDIYTQVVRTLPFTVAGSTTISQAVSGIVDTFLFSILILTSDDCSFACGCSDILPQESDAVKLTQECYTGLCSKLDGENRLTLIYTPLLDNYFPGQYIDVISEIDPKVPIFGMVANAEQSTAFSNSGPRTLLDDQEYYDRIVMVLISGDISPEFYISSLTDDVVAMPRVGEVTAAEKNRILKINNIGAVEFFEKVGIMGSARNKGLLSTTFIMDIKDKADDSGVVISRTPYLIEGGAVYCGGYINEGAILSIAFSTPEAVIQTAKEITVKIKESRKNTALMYSCEGRRFSLLSEPQREMEVIADTMPENCSYVAAYASGEICPALTTPEKAYNHEHNQTLVACVF